MTMPRIEHVNLTVGDPEGSARLLEQLFGWRVRWDGPNRAGGRTIHVGSDKDYLALSSGAAGLPAASRHAKGLPLNHIGVEVDDLEAAETRVRAAGLEPTPYDVYEPGRRFYFFDPNGVEFEVVSYAQVAAV